MDNKVILNEFESEMKKIDTEYGNKNCSVTDIEIIVGRIIGSLPNINRSELRKEMSNTQIEKYPTPTTFDINKGLAMVHGYKSRLTEIMNVAKNEAIIRKRVIDMLTDVNNAMSTKTSVDKRRGEAVMKYTVLTLQLQAAEAFYSEVEMIFNNIKSAGDLISRQGSIIQSQIALGEYRKKTGEDFKNFGEADEKPDYHSGAPKIDMSWDKID